MPACLAPACLAAAAGQSILDVCAPRTSLDLAFPAVEVASLRAWLASEARGPALATAAPGSGLSTLVRLLARELALDVVWVTPGTERVRDLLERAGSAPVSVTLRRKAIVVDELDSTDSSGAAEALAFARGSPRVPVLFLARTTRSQKTHEFARTWPRFPLGRPPPRAVAAVLERARRLAGYDADDAALAGLAAAAKGDVRAALLALETSCRGPAPQAAGPAAPATAFLKDEATEGLDLVENILRGDRARDVRDAMRVFGMEPAVTSMGLYENYLSAGAAGAADVSAAARAADWFSAGDALDGYMHSRQAWDLWDHYGACVVAGPALSLPPAPGAAVTKFGTVWSKGFNSCAKRKHLHSLALRLAEARAAPLAPEDLGWVRCMLRAALARPDDAAGPEVARLTEPWDEAEVLLLARLGVGPAWYKPAVHARVSTLRGRPPAPRKKTRRKPAAKPAA
jgi:hypothetical protein